MPTPPASLAVVVVNYGSSALLERNLAPLSRDLLRTLPSARIVVVDNRSTDEERAAIQRLAAAEDWSIVLPETNTGFGIGMNLGVAHARELGATAFLLLNPDATIAPREVAKLVDRVTEHPLRLIAPRILRPDGSIWFEGSDLYLADGRIRSRRRRPAGARLAGAGAGADADAGAGVQTGAGQTRAAQTGADAGSGPELEPWLSGACLAVSAELWDRVSGFAPEYFLYWEDVDLSHRVVDAGGELEVCSDIEAVHAEGGTQAEGHESAGEAKSETYYYYNIRNRLVFAALNLSRARMRTWRRLSIPIAYEVLLQGGRRQFLHPLRPVRAAFRGIRDGRRFVREAERQVRAAERQIR